MRTIACISFLACAAFAQVTTPVANDTHANVRAAINSNLSAIDTALSGKAASNASTTVNGQTCALGSTCTVADSTKVPTTRTVNGHALSGDVTVTKSDVGLGNVTNAAQEPALGNPDADGKVLSSTAAGVRSWVALGAGHTQNTDTGTTATSFQIDSGNSGPRIKNNAGTMEVRNAADAALAPLRVSQLNVGDGTVAGELSALELVANGTNYISWLAPDAITSTLRLKFPNADPTAGQVLSFGAPVANVATGAWITPTKTTDTLGVFAATTSAQLAGVITNETGSGSLVLATSPTLVTPDLGTPSAATLTNATGLPISTGVSGLGTGVATFLATPSSANLASAVTGETGSGSVVFAPSPTLTTPNLGTPSAVNLSNATNLADAALAAKHKTRNFTFVIPGSGASNVLQDTDDVLTTTWQNTLGSGITITGVSCEADTATPTRIQLTRRDGSPANILTNNTGAGLDCTSTRASGTIDTNEDNVANGQGIGYLTVTAGGSNHEVSVTVTYTID